jgi:hypothetical protein
MFSSLKNTVIWNNTIFLNFNFFLNFFFEFYHLTLNLLVFEFHNLFQLIFL